MPSWMQKTRVTLEMIKWEHSIFALPFALTGAVLAARGWPTLRITTIIILCMVSARTSAMAFNRWADAELDAANPRTQSRAIPARLLDRSFVAAFVVISAAVFILGCALLNRLCLLLSPVCLAVLLGYSYAKRFTRWSHLVLGLALGIAPTAAWIAVRGSLDARILLLTLAVLLWVAGFDVLYACQDFDHDRAAGLNSIPQSFGIPAAFAIARMLHVLMLITLLVLIHAFVLGPTSLAGVAVTAALLLYEHSIISPTDLRRMNAAFFTLNGVISVVFLLFIASDVLLHR